MTKFAAFKLNLRWLLIISVGCLAGFLAAQPQPAYMESIRPSIMKAFYAAVLKGNASALSTLLAKPFIDVNEVQKQRTPLIMVLHSAHAAIESYNSSNEAAVLLKLSNYQASLQALLDAGAWAGYLCPVLEAVVFSNTYALESLVQHMNTSELSFCLSAPDDIGQNLLHSLAKTKSSGFARLLFRLRQTSDVHFVQALVHQLGMAHDVLPEGLELMRGDIEALAGTRDYALLRERSGALGVDLLPALSAVDDNGCTPIVVACANGKLQVAQLMLEGLPMDAVLRTTAQQECSKVITRRGFTRFPGNGAFLSSAADGVQLDAVGEQPISLHTQQLPFRRFNVSAFSMTGWRLAHLEQLSYTHLDARSWSAYGVAMTAMATRLTPTVLTESLNVAAAVEADLPFIYCSHLDLHSLQLSKAKVTLHENYLNRNDFLRVFAHVPVKAGSIPYASTYGFTSDSLTVEAFVKRHMGSMQKLSQDGKRTHLTDGQLDLLNCTFGAGSESLAPPYIFDGSVMGKEARLFARWLAAIPQAMRMSAHGMEQLIIGPPMSGAMPHFHGAATNLLVSGLKLWLLVPPGCGSFTQLHAAHWFHSVATSPSVSCAGDRVYIFLQEPGDIVFVPEHWGHAVLNLADSIAIAVE
jgi:hypothetical protein